MPAKDLKPTTKKGVTCICFNGDLTMAALCPNSNDILIYETNGSQHTTKWGKTPKYTLSEHTETVVGLDWFCGKDAKGEDVNLLVSCSHDRNAYVWKHEKQIVKHRAGKEYVEDSDRWVPDLVILRINRGATAVKWSPHGRKFAVSSASKVVPICYYNAERKWWACTIIKKHKSTVLDVAWCPNSKFVVTGSTDYKCRIISAYMEGLDDPNDHGFGDIFPNAHKFGEVLAQFDQAKAWVQSVAWSPSQYRVAFTGHGSTIHFVQLLAGEKPIVTSIKASGLPYTSVEFVSSKCVIAAGYDQNPHLYSASDAQGGDPTWSFEANVDKEVKKEKKGLGSFSGARAMFEAKSNRGQSGGNKSNKKNTIHQNAILGIVPRGAGFLTYGIDGLVAYWDLKNQGFNAQSLMAEED